MTAIDKALQEQRKEVKHRIENNWCPKSFFPEAKQVCKNEETGAYDFNKGDDICKQCWEQEI